MKNYSILAYKEKSTVEDFERAIPKRDDGYFSVSSGVSDYQTNISVIKNSYWFHIIMPN